MRVLVLTGPPAVGKSTVGRLVAEHRPRCALVDTDDVRHLVVGGHVAPWQGPEGRRQQRLGVQNACALACALTGARFDVVVTDVLDEVTAALYRDLLPDPLVVRLRVGYREALRRQRSRRIHLTWPEFRMLHRREATFSAADVSVETTGLSAKDTAERVARLWSGPLG
ncbi:MAG TPA: AAA family ATPase [Mycobacteriales bacterium]|nr:AAA family ATPase [Mycobacteriales bacterium]